MVRDLFMTSERPAPSVTSEAGEAAVLTVRFRRGAYVWQVGSGHTHIPRGRQLEGRLLRFNAFTRRLVIRSGERIYVVNEEDVEWWQATAEVVPELAAG